MTDINNLFFELIQVSLGTRICLSHTPSADEWGELYSMAKKQSLVGVCFAGIQRLQTQMQEPPEMTYLTWMGMAAKIQQINEVVNRQCVELQAKLAADGMDCCILKGQGVARLYKVSGFSEFQVSSDLSLLRQSGDIDVWVQNRSIEELVDYCKQQGVNYKATAAHVECDMLEGTDIELHAEPAFMRNFQTDRKLKKWFAKFDVETFPNVNGLVVPSLEFNLVYLMVHMYHHVLFEGLGLRQLMDYYFVLRTSYDNDTFHYDNDNMISTLNSFGMLKFASGNMWIMKEVFGMEDECLICEANEKYGRLILEDVMTGGNFGHHDEKNMGLHGGSAIGRSINGQKRNMKFFALGSWEILSSPVWSLWHFYWRKKRGFK